MPQTWVSLVLCIVFNFANSFLRHCETILKSFDCLPQGCYVGVCTWSCAVIPMAKVLIKEKRNAKMLPMDLLQRPGRWSRAVPLKLNWMGIEILQGFYRPYLFSAIHVLHKGCLCHHHGALLSLLRRFPLAWMGCDWYSFFIRRANSRHISWLYLKLLCCQRHQCM